MAFEAFTPGQDAAAKKILEGSSLEQVGLTEEGTVEHKKVKEGTDLYPRDENDRTIIGQEEANRAEDWLNEKGSNTEGWKVE